jgi:ABC-type lipoprotein release transport system permease subunit
VGAESELFGLERTNPFVMTFAAVAVIMVTTVSAWLPAHGATRMDPMSALE